MRYEAQQQLLEKPSMLGFVPHLQPTENRLLRHSQRERDLPMHGWTYAESGLGLGQLSDSSEEPNLFGTNN